MKKLLKFLLVCVIICAVAFLGIKLVHKCDSCDKIFVGTGYEANVLADVVSDEDQTICKQCAEKQHVLETALGKSLDEYKKSLFD